MINKNVFIGYFKIKKDDELKFDSKVSPVFLNNKFNNEIIDIKDILTSEEVCTLIHLQNKNKKIPVGVCGIAKNYLLGDEIHSYRSTIYSEYIAKCIFERIKDNLQSIASPYEESSDLFKPIGVNPAFRFIDYNVGGHLVPHYDFPYKKDNDNLTLLSLVIYLTDSLSGNTRYIKEYRENDFTDWDRQPLPSEVLFEVKPKSGHGLLFPHNILHDSETVLKKKIILRTDILFQRISE